MFEKETYKMVQIKNLFLRWVHARTLYKLLGSIIIDGCNSSTIWDDGDEKDKTSIFYGEKIMLWNQRLVPIGEKGVQELQGEVKVEGMYDFIIDLDFANISFTVNIIR